MAIANQTKTVVGVFNSVDDAQSAVRELESLGISRDDISVVANKNAVGYDSMDEVDRDKASDVVADAGIGAAIGGVGGLLLSAAGALTVPVIGPILAAGPIAAALTGAGIGAAAGGLIGALTESGIPEDEAKHYAEGVRRGDVLLTVKVDPSQAGTVSDILDRFNAIDVDDRVSSWKDRGYTGFNNESTPYTPEELRTERTFYTRGSVTEAGNLAGDAATPGLGTAGTVASGLGAGYSTPAVTGDYAANRGYDQRTAGEKVRESFEGAEEKVREWGKDIKAKGSEWKADLSQKGNAIGNEARETTYRAESQTNPSGPGNPDRGTLSDRIADNMGEAGKEVREFGRDANDVLHGRTGKQPHDYSEEARDAERERRKRSRVYDRM